MDLGGYCVHVLLRLFGKPGRIFADCVKLRNGIDGAGAILAVYESMTAELLYSKVSDSCNPCEIQGEEGIICFDNVITLQGMRLIRRDTKRPTPSQCPWRRMICFMNSQNLSV